MEKDMILNESAKLLFDSYLIDEIPPVDEYPIWKKTDPFGRMYYGVSDFNGLDSNIEKDSDLSWLEWAGNDVYLGSPDRNDIMMLFRKAVGIMKSWQTQLIKDFPNERFVIFAYFNDDVEYSENSDLGIAFTMRFWKIREGQGFVNESTESDLPVLKIIIG